MRKLQRVQGLGSTFCVCLLLGLGCAEALPEEPLAGEDDLSFEQADGVPTNLWTYYAVGPACEACEELMVSRLNQPEARCADGQWAKVCLVEALDFSRAGLSPADAEHAQRSAREGRSILRGKLVERSVAGRTIPVFQATESWESDTPGAPRGLWMWLGSRAPCEDEVCAELVGTRLNKSGAATATYPGAHGAGLDPAHLGRGVIIVGELVKRPEGTFIHSAQGWSRRGFTEGGSDRTDGPSCAANALSSFPKDELRIHVIDVGQGDAIWIQTPWKTARSESLNVLVDAGPSGTMPGSSPGGQAVVSYLLAAGLEEGDLIDALVVTHAHDDHFGGVERVAQSFGIARYADPGFAAGSSAFLAARAAATAEVAHHEGHVHVPAVSELVPRLFTGSNLFGPRVETTVLWAAEAPPSGRVDNPTGPDVNNTSIALSLRYGGRQVLLMGDVEAAVESALIAAHDAGEIDLTASVLKVAHHGSARSTSTEFLARAFAKAGADSWAVISSGRRPFTGSFLPSEPTLERLRAALPSKRLLSTENRDEHKVVGTEHGDDSVLVRVKASGAVSACYVR